MSKFYLDKNGVSYFWSKIKAYVLGVLPQPYTSNPSMNGSASAGSSAKYAKGDHVHPSDTAKAAAVHTHTKSDITDFPNIHNMPSGGSTGQVLTKDSSTDYDASWSSPDVADVQVAGSSVVTDGVADVPVASKTDFGVVKAEVVGSDGNHGQLKITYKDSNTNVSYALPLMSANDGTGKILGFLLPYATTSKQGAIRLSRATGSPLEDTVKLFYGSGSSDYYEVPSIGETSNLIKAMYLPEATTSSKGAMSATDKTKLDGIASGAEANVQSDWNESDSSDDAYIANKPSIHNVPSGGTSGQVLSKASGTDYDVEWTTPSGGGGGGDYTATSPIDITNDVISHDASGVTAGSYGSYNSSTPSYFIPSITVDAEGHITSASQSYLGPASSKSTGLLSASDYAKFSSGFTTQSTITYVGGGFSGSFGTSALPLFTNGYPLVVGAYINCYINSSTKAWVAADDIRISSAGDVSGRIPSKYMEFNGDPADEENVSSYSTVVIYKSGSSAGM